MPIAIESESRNRYFESRIGSKSVANRNRIGGWVPMGTHGNPWGPMGTHGDPWGLMGPHGNPWDPMVTHGTPWGPMGTP